MIDVTYHIVDEVSRIVKLIGDAYIQQAKKASQNMNSESGN